MAYPDTIDTEQPIEPMVGDLIDYDRLAAMLGGGCTDVLVGDPDMVRKDTVEGFPGVGACDGDGTRLVIYL